MPDADTYAEATGALHLRYLRLAGLLVLCSCRGLPVAIV